MSILKQSLTELNSKISFNYTTYHTRVKEYSLLYYLLIAGGRIVGFISIQRVSVLCEMQVYIYMLSFLDCYIYIYIYTLSFLDCYIFIF